LLTTAPIHRAASAVVNLATKCRIADSLEQLRSVSRPVVLVVALVGALAVVARLSLVGPFPAVVVLAVADRDSQRGHSCPRNIVRRPRWSCRPLKTGRCPRLLPLIARHRGSLALWTMVLVRRPFVWHPRILCCLNPHRWAIRRIGLRLTPVWCTALMKLLLWSRPWSVHWSQWWAAPISRSPLRISVSSSETSTVFRAPTSQSTPTTLAKSDLRRFIVTAWCVHPDMIPHEKLLYIPEPKFAHVWGPPLFVNPEEFIHHDQPTLFYRVGFDVLEVEDWHVPSDSSSSNGGSDSGGDGLPSGHGGFSQPWHKKTRFSMLRASMIAPALVVAWAWDSGSVTLSSPGRLPHRRPAPLVWFHSPRLMWARGSVCVCLQA
jgi:hypothetical protein